MLDKKLEPSACSKSVLGSGGPWWPLHRTVLSLSLRVAELALHHDRTARPPTRAWSIGDGPSATGTWARAPSQGHDGHSHPHGSRPGQRRPPGPESRSGQSVGCDASGRVNKSALWSRSVTRRRLVIGRNYYLPADYGRLNIALLATAGARVTTGSDSDAPSLSDGPGSGADEVGIVRWVAAGGSWPPAPRPGYVRGAVPRGINAWWTGARGAARSLGRATGSAGTAAPPRGAARRVVSLLSRATGFAMGAGTRWLSWRRPLR
jgi:hypothetical protein